MTILPDLVILFGIAVAAVLIFRRLQLPSIVGFLMAGILAGPSGFALISTPHHVEQAAEIGVVLLLFTIGIELSLPELRRIAYLLLVGGGLQVGLTILTVAALSGALGFPLGQALFFGFLVALSSTAILIKMLMDAGEMDSPHAKATIGILIFQDLCIVPLMLFTPLLAEAGSFAGSAAVVLGKAVAVIVGAYFLARKLIPWVFALVVKTRSRELFILTIIFIGFGTAWLTASAGLSLALGAFIAGLAISESEYSHQVMGDLIPFRDALMSLFFVSIGMLLDLAMVLAEPLLLAGLTLAIIAIKVLIAGFAGVLLGLPLRIAVMVALAIAQVGEFSFVLSQVGLQHGLLDPRSYQLFLAASVITMMLTPFCLRLSVPLADALVALAPTRLVRGRQRLVRRPSPRALRDHVIIAGYGLNGKNVATALRHLEIPHVIVDCNPYQVSAERQCGAAIVLGDATSAEVLQHLHIETARTLIVAISDAAATRRIVVQARRLNAVLHIIVRTRYLAEVEPLARLGANEVVPEEFETSLEILARSLRVYMLPEDVIDDRVAEIRRNGYAMLRSAGPRHGHAPEIAAYLSGAEIATFQVKRQSVLAGQSLREGTLRRQSGATILAIKRGAEICPNPDPVWQLREGDLVLTLGTPEQLKMAARLFGPA
jgi:CPA2 family monovalent cation:H+ antiporter-2